MQLYGHENLDIIESVHLNYRYLKTFLNLRSKTANFMIPVYGETVRCPLYMYINVFTRIIKP